jgi:hypothetical protein
MYWCWDICWIVPFWTPSLSTSHTPQQHPHKLIVRYILYAWVVMYTWEWKRWCIYVPRRRATEEQRCQSCHSVLYSCLLLDNVCGAGWLPNIWCAQHWRTWWYPSLPTGMYVWWDICWLVTFWQHPINRLYHLTIDTPRVGTLIYAAHACDTSTLRCTPMSNLFNVMIYPKMSQLFETSIYIV